MTILVKYWCGTTRVEGRATTYRGAMRIATRNQNAYGPTFWTREGEQLHDDSNCLIAESELDRHSREPKTALRAYA